MNRLYLHIGSIVFFTFLWISGIYFWTAFGLAFTVYIFLHLLDGMGKKIPIIELITALASLQWILGPFIEYQKEFHHYRYRMYVDEETYMSFIVPAILAFWVGCNIFKSRVELNSLRESVGKLLEEHPGFPYVLIITGMIAPYLSPIFPPSLGFVFFLVSNIKYIGVIYLIHSKHKYRWLIFFSILLLTAVSAIAAGMFHDLLLWSMLLFTFLAKEWKLKFSQKLLFAVAGILLAVTIQSVKSQYRMHTWGKNYQGNKTGLFLSIAFQEWARGDIFMPKSEVDMNVRLNQGWIISAVMYNVPDNITFVKGETIKEGIIASLVPRMLAPNKKIAGGRENFRRFTGLPISDGTSMGISIAGEGYANYGWIGGIVFMFFWGFFISGFWRLLEKWSEFFPTLLLWSPILFLQVVKAETEFAVVLNHLIKSSIVVFGLIWAVRLIWGESLQRRYLNDEEKEPDLIENTSRQT